MHILFSVYEDVPKALESWTNDGRKIYVYSSGSVEAQELLFEHSIHGNLLKVLGRRLSKTIRLAVRAFIRFNTFRLFCS